MEEAGTCSRSAAWRQRVRVRLLYESIARPPLCDPPPPALRTGAIQRVRRLPGLHTQAHAVRLEVVRGGFRRPWQTVDDETILAVDLAAP